MLLVFGEADPHVPAEGRQQITTALEAAGTRHTVRLVPGEHAFMRDEGPRYDSALADQIWAETVALFKRVLS